jgi:NDP-4-keto-2,6-dideoxyhexose 3-C-methyltransferase
MISICRICKSGNLVSVLDLNQQYLSDFRVDLSKPEKFALNLLLCEDCGLAQLDTTVDRDLMYHDGYGYKSGTNELIRANLKWIVETGLKHAPSAGSWLDIACNDGTLLSFVPRNFRRVGVDPVKKFSNESKVHADKIISDFFSQGVVEEKFDIITSISMFYDLDDPESFAREVKSCLSSKGVWVVQQNYLASMIENVSFDNICHEHITYFSLTSLNNLILRIGLEIIDLEFPAINGGSVMTVLAHKGIHNPSPLVEETLEKEARMNIASREGFKEFETLVNSNIQELKNILLEISQKNERIQIYGASTRGGTIWQSLEPEIGAVESAVERQVEKVGKIYSVIGKEIISEEEMRANPPDYLLIGPWFLRESFLSRENDYLVNGGSMIFPLPKVEIIKK